MSVINEETRESDVPKQALEALTAAQIRSVQAGHPQVLVQDGVLVRISAGGTTVLKRLPKRRVVSVRTRFVKR